jgi:hypothetical protein
MAQVMEIVGHSKADVSGTAKLAFAPSDFSIGEFSKTFDLEFPMPLTLDEDFAHCVVSVLNVLAEPIDPTKKTFLDVKGGIGSTTLGGTLPEMYGLNVSVASRNLQIESIEIGFVASTVGKQFKWKT